MSSNPVRDMAVFVCAGAGSRALDIVDTQGRLIERLTGSDGRWAWAPRSSAPAGIYFARLADGEDREAVKFLCVR